MRNKHLSFFSKKRSRPSTVPQTAATPTSTSAGLDTSIPQRSHVAKENLQGVTLGADVANPALGGAEVRALEQDVFEALRLGRSRRNDLAPISRIPPEVLALIPNFVDEDFRDRATIALTHVCQAWREIFTSG